MLRRARLRTCVLLLFLALLAPPVFGQGVAPSGTLRARSLFAWFWQALGELVPGIAKSRGTMDPNGSPDGVAPPPYEAEGDSRGIMDPDGHS